MSDRTVVDVFFFNDTATTEIYTLSLHDALPISTGPRRSGGSARASPRTARRPYRQAPTNDSRVSNGCRSEEHTSELQSRQYLVWRLLLEKKNIFVSHADALTFSHLL